MSAKKKIEWFKPITCRWSGFRLLADEEMNDCTPDAKYRNYSLVLGWVVMQWRVWTFLGENNEGLL